MGFLADAAEMRDGEVELVSPIAFGGTAEVYQVDIVDKIRRRKAMAFTGKPFVLKVLRKVCVLFAYRVTSRNPIHLH